MGKDKETLVQVETPDGEGGALVPADVADELVKKGWRPLRLVRLNGWLAAAVKLIKRRPV